MTILQAEPFLDANNAIANFVADNKNSALFKFKQNITGKTTDVGTKDVEIIVALKYFSNFWRTLEMSLIKCEINHILAWSEKCVYNEMKCEKYTKATTFAIIANKPYVPFVILSIKDNINLLQQLKSGFKRTINWNKYHSN